MEGCSHMLTCFESVVFNRSQEESVCIVNHRPFTEHPNMAHAIFHIFFVSKRKDLLWRIPMPDTFINLFLSRRMSMGGSSSGRFFISGQIKTTCTRSHSITSRQPHVIVIDQSQTWPLSPLALAPTMKWDYLLELMCSYSNVYIKTDDKTLRVICTACFP